MRPRSSLALLAAMLLTACNGSLSSVGERDAGPAPDAGAAGQGDGGGADGGPGFPGDGGAPVTCAEAGQIDIWAPIQTSLDLPGDLGRILACEHLATLTGYDEFAIQYVSQGPIGTPHRVTALLYTPSGGKGSVPLVAVNHGTSGMGPACGPTHSTAVVDYMAVPMVQAGYAVVATDYPGMGVDEGSVSPYLVGEAEGLSIVDAVRATLRFHDSRFDASQLSGELFLAGHSQGGQATLFAHALYDSSVGPTLLGSISFAPGLGDLREFGQAFNAATPTAGVGTLLLMGLYGNMAYYGTPDPSSWLSSTAAQKLPTILHDQCLSEEEGSIPNQWPNLGQAVTSAFLSAAQGCSFDGGACPGFAPWATELEGDVPGAFTSSVPALLMQGEQDTLVLPATTACIAARLEAHGTPVQACGYANADHLSIVSASIQDALSWMAARRKGNSPDVCPAPLAESCPP